jgi:hypothetical protein
MAQKQPQNYKNHKRYVIGYHVVATLILLINLVWSVYRVIADISTGTVITAVLAIGLILVFYYARVFALAVQDRLIRLEERLRFARLLPEDLQSKIDDFTAGQLIGLRFASDEELPELARKVVDENIQNREDIKKLIRNWRADYQRA